MNWTVPLIAFFAAVMAGGRLDARLAGKSDGTERRRVVRAALPLPGLVLLLSAAAIAWTVLAGPGEGENMTDLAVAIYISLGLLFAVLTFAGGLLGASMAERKRRQ